MRIHGHDAPRRFESEQAAESRRDAALSDARLQVVYIRSRGIGWVGAVALTDRDGGQSRVRLVLRIVHTRPATIPATVGREDRRTNNLLKWLRIQGPVADVRGVRHWAQFSFEDAADSISKILRACGRELKAPYNIPELAAVHAHYTKLR